MKGHEISMYKVSDKTLLNVKSEYVKYMIYLFEETSKDIFPETINVPNEEWFDYIDSIYSVCKQKTPKKIVTNCLPDIKVDNVNDKGIFVGFSGGSDSCTYVKRLLELGYDVKLYSLFNVNRGIKSENNVVKNLAKYFNLPLFFDTFNFSGNINQNESPIKNHLIATYMITYMVDNKITNFCEGLFACDTLGYHQYAATPSDYVDIFKLFVKAIKKTFPQFNLVVLFKNSAHRAAYMVKYCKDLIPLYQSCISQDYRRGNYRKSKEKKYHFSSKGLPENRCMVCGKCIIDYLYLGIFGYLEINKDYIKDFVEDRFLYLYKIDYTKETKSIKFNKLIHEIINFEDCRRYLKDPNEIEVDFLNVYNSLNRQ